MERRGAPARTVVLKLAALAGFIFHLTPANTEIGHDPLAGGSLLAAILVNAALAVVCPADRSLALGGLRRLGPHPHSNV
jgi:hypothetical protein